MVCPLDSAWLLSQTWPDAELLVVRDAGHAIKEPGLIDAIIIASKKLAKRRGEHS